MFGSGRLPKVGTRTWLIFVRTWCCPLTQFPPMMNVLGTHNDPARSMLLASPPDTHLALRTCCGQSELQVQTTALGTLATRPPVMPRKLGLPIGPPIEGPDTPCALATMPIDTLHVVAGRSQAARQKGTTWPVACQHRGIVRASQNVVEALCATGDGTWDMQCTLNQHLPSALQVQDPMGGVSQLLFFFDAIAARSILECLCPDRSPEDLTSFWAPNLWMEVLPTLLLSSTPAYCQ